MIKITWFKLLIKIYKTGKKIFNQFKKEVNKNGKLK